MKKLSVAILALIYLAVSSGFSVNINYCMGKPAYVDLYNHSDTCNKCGMKTKAAAGCCKHERKLIKLNDTHKLISNDINFSSPVAVLNNNKSIFDIKSYNSAVLPEFGNHSPPVFLSSSLYILHCVFRI